MWIILLAVFIFCSFAIGFIAGAEKAYDRGYLDAYKEMSQYSKTHSSAFLRKQGG